MEGTPWGKLFALATLLTATFLVAEHRVLWPAALTALGALIGLELRQSRKAVAGKLLESWDTELLYRKLEGAHSGARLKLLNTFFTDDTRLIPRLEKLLTRGDKQFSLRILLLDPEGSNDIVSARAKLRSERPELFQERVHQQIQQLTKMKERVDSSWSHGYPGTKLDLEIRLWDHLPSGIYYQFGSQAIFLGLLLAEHSSIHGPMVHLSDPTSVAWKALESDFDASWEGSRVAYPQRFLSGAAEESAISAEPPTMEELVMFKAVQDYGLARVRNLEGQNSGRSALALELAQLKAFESDIHDPTTTTHAETGVALADAGGSPAEAVVHCEAILVGCAVALHGMRSSFPAEIGEKYIGGTAVSQVLELQNSRPEFLIMPDTPFLLLDQDATRDYRHMYVIHMVRKTLLHHRDAGEPEVGSRAIVIPHTVTEPALFDAALVENERVECTSQVEFLDAIRAIAPGDFAIAWEPFTEWISRSGAPVTKGRSELYTVSLFARADLLDSAPQFVQEFCEAFASEWSRPLAEWEASAVELLEDPEYKSALGIVLDEYRATLP